jgi:hypothetical protein
VLSCEDLKNPQLASYITIKNSLFLTQNTQKKAVVGIYSDIINYKIRIIV